MRKTVGALIGAVLLSIGCTTNVYHVKAENHYYIIPFGDLQQDESDELPDQPVTVLTKGGTNYLVLPHTPNSPKAVRKSSRAL
jgi:hypothetical protein